MIKKNKISLVTCGLLLTSTLSFASDSISDAFKEGSISGSATLYGIDKDAKGGMKNSDDSFATFGLSYETSEYKGLSAKASFIGGHAFSNSSLDENSLMTEAYVKYTTDGFSVSAGRQEIDLEWLGDYNESIVAAITSIPNTTIVAGFVNQQAAADEDEIGKFDKITKDGAYVLDLKYTGISSLELNPYFYSAVDVADFYGLKATYASDIIGVTAQYAASSEEVGADGSIGHVELSTEVSGLSISTGYIKTDKDVGVKSIAAYGDNISPFDEGANTYSSDAKTVYASLGYTLAGVNLSALYGETDFSVSSEEKELNIAADYSFSDNLSLSVLYVDYDLEGSDSSDFNSVSGTVTYSF